MVVQNILARLYVKGDALPLMCVNILRGLYLILFTIKLNGILALCPHKYLTAWIFLRLFLFFHLNFCIGQEHA